MIDLITVVHQPEIPYLELQGRSIENYFAEDFLGTIHIIVNDSKDVCNLIDTAWWGKYQHKVNIVPKSIYGFKTRVTGWESQQLCKLLAASRTWQPWAMILDAKTFFVKACNQALIFDNSNKVNTKSQKIYPAFVESQQSVERLYNISMNKTVGPGGVPFIIESSTVRDMISYLEAKSNITFADFFQTYCKHPYFVTEFYLYSGYVQLKYGNISQLYSNRQDWECVNLADWQADNFNTVFADMLKDNVLTVSIQARAWPLLSNKQKLQYVTLLKTKNLTDDIEYTLEQLNTVVIN